MISVKVVDHVKGILSDIYTNSILDSDVSAHVEHPNTGYSKNMKLHSQKLCVFRYDHFFGVKKDPESSASIVGTLFFWKSGYPKVFNFI